MTDCPCCNGEGSLPGDGDLVIGARYTCGECGVELKMLETGLTPYAPAGLQDTDAAFAKALTDAQPTGWKYDDVEDEWFYEGADVTVCVSDNGGHGVIRYETQTHTQTVTWEDHSTLLPILLALKCADGAFRKSACGSRYSTKEIACTAKVLGV